MLKPNYAWAIQVPTDDKRIRAQKIMHNSASFTLDLVMAECWTTSVKARIDAATILKVFNERALGQMMSL